MSSDFSFLFLKLNLFSHTSRRILISLNHAHTKSADVCFVLSALLNGKITNLKVAFNLNYTAFKFLCNLAQLKQWFIFQAAWITCIEKKLVISWYQWSK